MIGETTIMMKMGMPSWTVFVPLTKDPALHRSVLHVQTPVPSVTAQLSPAVKKQALRVTLPAATVFVHPLYVDPQSFSVLPSTSV